MLSYRTMPHYASRFFIVACALICVTLVLVLTFVRPARSASLSENVKGYILLQVERNGEAWYVFPASLTRFYLGRPLDAFNIMRYKGLGITNANLEKIPRAGTNDGAGDTRLREQVAGRILLQVERNGEAWYVYPKDLKRYYLGRPRDAFNLMRQLGLGISNSNLDQVAIDSQSLSDRFVQWTFNGSSWVNSGIPPTCDDPHIFQTPVDLAKVYSVLYPGQYRGGDYKLHGGFRFDGRAYNSITVTAPATGYIIDGVRYSEGGVVQYMFDFQMPCGIAYRFDHLNTLSPTLAAIANSLPAPKEGDSRTTQITPVKIEAGTVLATAVGTPSNVFVDWGVYDLRARNQAAASSSYRTTHANEASQAYYGVCWFDWLSSAASATVRAKPASGGDSSSDYCS